MLVFSATNHEEEQRCHLQLADDSIPIKQNLPDYDEPAQLYCRLGFYEVIEDETTGVSRFQINGQNCCIAKRATLRIRRKTSPGLHQRAVGGLITRICKRRLFYETNQSWPGFWNFKEPG